MVPVLSFDVAFDAVAVDVVVFMALIVDVCVVIGVLVVAFARRDSVR